jgi:hypothetical protein
MKQTEKFKGLIKELKKKMKLSSIMGKNSTYMKITGIDFNGTKYGNLTDLDKRRLSGLIDETRIILNKLEFHISNHEDLD